MKTIWYTHEKGETYDTIKLYEDKEKKCFWVELHCLLDDEGEMFLGKEEEIQQWLDDNGYGDDTIEMVHLPNGKMVHIKDIQEQSVMLFQDNIFIGLVENQLQFLDIRLQVKMNKLNNVFFRLQTNGTYYDYPIDENGGVDYNNKPYIFNTACDQLNELLGI